MLSQSAFVFTFKMKLAKVPAGNANAYDFRFFIVNTLVFYTTYQIRMFSLLYR